jgi:prepilin-type N-terminal cleavage/methylation domain-containing protein
MIKKQRGVTLIELMIGMVLGLSLVAGIGSLFIQSQKSFRIQKNVSDMTDDAAFVLEDLAKAILLAGYSKDGTKNYPSATNAVFSISGSPVVPAINFSNDEEFIYGADEVSNSGKGDQLVYRYKLGDLAQLDNTVCTSFTELKAIAAVEKTITVRLYKKYDADAESFVLYCKPAVDNVSKDAQPLISNVEKLEFLYGIKRLSLDCADSDAPTIEDYCFHYTDATNITNNNQWKNVYAVKVFLVMRSADDNVVRIQTGYKIDDVQQLPLPNDKRLYKVFTKTIYLRTNDQ